MKIPIKLFVAALVATGGSAIALDAPVWHSLDATSNVVPSDDATELAKKYEEAVAEYREKLRAADREGRKKLRKAHPIYEFWPRFESMAGENDGVALFWMVENIAANKSIKRADRKLVLHPIYKALCEYHTGAEWFPAVLDNLQSDAGLFEKHDVVDLVKLAVENVEEGEARGATLLLAAKTLMEIDRPTADVYLDEIEAKYSDQHVYTAAKALVTKPSDLEKGKVAPDFLGETIDGFKFKLSDYRGKVVVLDFYGFW